jgi:m7GpppX diphosphatase
MSSYTLEKDPPESRNPHNRSFPLAQRAVVTCSPEVAFGERMRAYIDTQRASPRKKWIYDIIDGTIEIEDRVADTEDVVLLPDTEAPNSAEVTNWLAVFKDTSLHTLRDMRGKHIPLLKRVRDLCVEKICSHTGHTEKSVMVYLHYLPSVFQLHLHVCAPYGQYTTFDACKIQPVETVISNLEIDPDYYRKARITTALIGRGELAEIYEKEGSKTVS